jgi:hypothetical protein
MYSHPRQEKRQPNVVLALALLWCVSVWFGLAYLLESALA